MPESSWTRLVGVRRSDTFLVGHFRIVAASRKRVLYCSAASSIFSPLHKGEGSQPGSRRPVRLLSFFEIDVGRPKPAARLLRLRSDRHTPEDRLAGSNLGPNFEHAPAHHLGFARPAHPEGAIAASGLPKMG